MIDLSHSPPTTESSLDTSYTGFRDPSESLNTSGATSLGSSVRQWWLLLAWFPQLFFRAPPSSRILMFPSVCQTMSPSTSQSESLCRIFLDASLLTCCRTFKGHFFPHICPIFQSRSLHKLFQTDQFRHYKPSVLPYESANFPENPLIKEGRGCDAGGWVWMRSTLFYQLLWGGMHILGFKKGGWGDFM